MARRARKATARSPTPAGEVRPGAVSRILDELARTEAQDLDQAWAASLAPGDVVGRFEMVREIGRGGFGVVYEARDRQLSRTVAFKALKPGKARLKLAAEWMRQEAEAAAQLNHPNIVTLHDVGSFRGHPFLILELLHGETLDARLSRGPLPSAEALDVALQVARALSHAHAAGVLHRDLKPSNVFLCRDGTAKVLDFGLARLLGSTSPSGGTPGYLAPERWRHEPEDARADVFAAGVMLFESLTGRRPWEAEDGSDLLSPAPPPRLEVRGLSAAVARAVAGAMAKDPAGRPRDGHAWLVALEEARGAGRGRRGLWLGGAVAAGLALAAAGAWLAARGGPGGPPASEAAAPVTVAVADVENATGEKDLDGLSGLLITSLEQSKKLSVLTRSRMLDMLQKPGQERIEHVDERLGREVSRRAGARALLLASIRRFDQVYALELKAIDPIADEYLFTVKEQGTGKASIPGLIDRVAEAGRRALREQAAEVSASRVQVASLTGSLEAYQHYFVGVQCIDGLGPVADCVEHFRKALAIDPSFALAHYMVAYTSEFRRAAPGEQKAAIEAALQHLDRAPPKERGLILAWKAHLEGKDDEASGIYKGLVERYPQDGHVAYTAGDLLFHKDDMAGALPYFEKADALGAAIPVMRHHIVAALFRLRRTAEGLERARAWAAAQPDAVHQQILATALHYGGDFAGAAEGARKAIEKGGGWESQALLVDALSMQGKIGEAEELARRLAGPEQSLAGRQAARVQLANLLAYQGRRREGLALLDAFRADGEGPTKGSAYRALWLLGGRKEQLAQARREAEKLADPRSAKGASVVAVVLALDGDLEAAEELARARDVEQEEVVRVSLEWARGDRAGALARLRALEAREPGHAYLLGELLAADGRDREAVEELRRFRTLPMDGAVRGWAYPRSLFLVATSLERMGDQAGARAEIDQLLQLWKRADPDQPLLAEARALRARLGDG